MTNPGFDPVSQARFQATMENELRHLWRQIDLIWDHHRKRRSEIEITRKDLSANIIAAQKQASSEIEAIKSRINGAIYSFALSAAGAVVILLKPHLGL